MTSAGPKRIISLTYHEITQDPRVLKQARVLRNAGYDVTVLCNWPEGLPQIDEIDGIRITRFNCYGPDHVRRDMLDELDFLQKSRRELELRYLPFASACDDLKKKCLPLERKFGTDVIERAQSKHFKTAAGMERVRRFKDYLRLNLLLKFSGCLHPVEIVDPRTGKNTIKRYNVLGAFRDYRYKLFQAEAVVYAANLPDPTPGDNVAAVHAHDIFCLPAGVMLARRLNVPLVYDAHEYEPARATKMDPKQPSLSEWIEDDCFRYVTRMITVSDGIGELYAKRFQGPTPEIVMNAPEIDTATLQGKVALRSGFKTVRDSARLAKDVPLIVFTGGIQKEHRGIDKVLEALTYLPNAHLVSLGPRNETNDNWLIQVAEHLGVKDRVTLLPPVDARDVPAAISTAHLSVCPFQDVSLNHRLAMPNKLFEAAFARIPICVSDLPEMRKFVEMLGIGRAMDQTDPKAIAAAFQDVFDNRDAFMLTPETERKLVETYSWQAQAAKLLALYDDIIGAP